MLLQHSKGNMSQIMAACTKLLSESLGAQCSIMDVLFSC